MKKLLYSLSMVLLLGLLYMPLPCRAAYFPGKVWRTVKSPEEAGWSSKKLRLVQRFADKMGSNGMVLYDGRILCKWGDIRKRGYVRSVRKSLLSALYGIYVPERRINLNATLMQLGIDDKEPKLTSQEKQARIIDLLQACSGVYHPTAAEPDSMKKHRPARGSHAPGTFWFYNNWDFNTLGVIFEKLTREKIGVAFKKRIANPIGMQDFSAEDVRYAYVKESVMPAYQFKLSARDMARFGLLYCQNGRWHGNQVIPSDWVAESTTSHSNAGRGQGYGYLWWVAKTKLCGNKIDVPAYTASGVGGQRIAVVPSRKLVLVNLSKAGPDSSKLADKLMKLVFDSN